MADDEQVDTVLEPEEQPKTPEDEAEALRVQVAEHIHLLQETNLIEDIGLLENVSYLQALWADFHLYITEPFIAPQPPRFVRPAYNKVKDTYENVYPIRDYGYFMSTSRGRDLAKGTRAMVKLFNTVEKMVALLIDRTTDISSGGASDAKEGDGGKSGDGEGDGTSTPAVCVAFYGHEQAQRKAFESVINLKQNVVVINFEPGKWGERYMKNVMSIADQGFGLPRVAPRKLDF